MGRSEELLLLRRETLRKLCEVHKIRVTREGFNGARKTKRELAEGLAKTGFTLISGSRIGILVEVCTFFDEG